jgi:hypothetical protein
MWRVLNGERVTAAKSRALGRSRGNSVMQNKRIRAEHRRLFALYACLIGCDDIDVGARLHDLYDDAIEGIPLGSASFLEFC